jgi:hypothetical protein
LTAISFRAAPCRAAQATSRFSAAGDGFSSLIYNYLSYFVHGKVLGHQEAGSSQGKAPVGLARRRVLMICWRLPGGNCETLLKGPWARSGPAGTRRDGPGTRAVERNDDEPASDGAGCNPLRSSACRNGSGRHGASELKSRCEAL